MTHQPIVRLERFIQATRDSGYKGTSSAIAELVDNALQAKATAVRITLEDRPGDAAHPVTVSVADNGQGMTGDVLAEALRFGGSSRFNDRRGLGRFGMGLPNASLSQSRRVEVFTWQRGKTPIWNYLDVDEIASGELSSVPRPKQGVRPRGRTHS